VTAISDSAPTETTALVARGSGSDVERRLLVVTCSLMPIVALIASFLLPQHYRQSRRSAGGVQS
jgi:hypothetical protein